MEKLIKYSRVNKFITIVVLCIIGWVAILATYLYTNKVSPTISNYIAKFEFIIHIITLIYLSSTYSQAKKALSPKAFRLFVYFLGIHFWLLIVDILFYVAAYTNNSFLQKLTLIYFLLYYIPCTIFGILACLFLSKILIRNILLANGIVGRTIGLFAVTATTLVMFLSSIHYSFAVFSINNILQIIMIFLEFLLFDISIIALLYASNISAFLFLSGVIVLINGDFFLTYTYISQTITLFLLGEFLWLLGLILLMFSAIGIKQYKQYKFKHWFKSDNAIRSRLGFSIFLSSTVGFLLAFIVTYMLGLVNKQVFVAFPLFIMLFSIIVALLSIFSARKFEGLFKKIEQNISILSNNQDEVVEDNFSIEEFIFLQHSIIQGFRFKQQQDILRKEHDIVASIAHDIASPLAAMNIALTNFKQSSNYEANLVILENSMQNVRDIADGLLKRYRNLGDRLKQNQSLLPEKSNSADMSRYINLYHIITKAIKIKEQEWSNYRDVELVFQSDDINNRLSWGYLSPLQISRVLSNLLNNAYESRDKSYVKIVVSLTINKDKFNIEIKDNGGGIAPDRIEMVLSGSSSKHNGPGMGLATAANYLKQINGELKLSSQLGLGTKVFLELPLVQPPNWYTKEIQALPNATLAIIANHQLNAENLPASPLNSISKGVRFNLNKITEFINWYNRNPNLQSAMTIVIELCKTTPNILEAIEDIIKLPKYHQIYILTDNYENIELQNLASEYMIKLIPVVLLDNSDIRLIDN